MPDEDANDMKRDFELIRQILLKIEQGNVSRSDASLVREYTNEKSMHHVDLLIDAGLIKNTPTGPLAGINRVLQLTWEGHEFISLIRDKNQWEQIKTEALENKVELTVQSIKIAASMIISKRLK